MMIMMMIVPQDTGSKSERGRSGGTGGGDGVDRGGCGQQ